MSLRLERVLQGWSELTRRERVQACSVIFGMLIAGHIPGASGRSSQCLGQLWFSPLLYTATHQVSLQPGVHMGTVMEQTEFVQTQASILS